MKKKISFMEALLSIEIGKSVLERLYLVEYDEIEGNEDELTQQREADLSGWGFNVHKT